MCLSCVLSTTGGYFCPASSFLNMMFDHEAHSSFKLFMCNHIFQLCYPPYGCGAIAGVCVCFVQKNLYTSLSLFLYCPSSFLRGFAFYGVSLFTRSSWQRGASRQWPWCPSGRSSDPTKGSSRQQDGGHGSRHLKILQHSPHLSPNTFNMTISITLYAPSLPLLNPFS